MVIDFLIELYAVSSKAIDNWNLFKNLSVQLIFRFKKEY